MKILIDYPGEVKAQKQFYLEMMVGGLAFVGLYFTVIMEMVKDWDTNPNFSHGYFIPFVAVAMIYSRREQLRNVPIAPSSWGVALLVVGLFQYFIASVGSEYFLQRSSMVVVLLGLALFGGGKAISKRLLYPLLYLLLMIPVPTVIWSQVSFPLQLAASALSENMVQLLGVPIFREGNILYLSETTLEVVDACSGLRSLTTMIALSLALIYFSRLTLGRRWLVFLAAFPIAILINIFRLTVTALMASKYGEEVAQGFLHDFSGWLTFVLGLLMLWGITESLEGKKEKYEAD